MTIKAKLEDLEMDGKGDDDPVSLPNGKAAIFYIRSFSGAPTTRMTLLLLKTMRTKKSEQMISQFGTKNSSKLTKEHFLNLFWLQTI